ncbi:MAG: P83/100 family protein [Treponema sp.]
MKRMLFLFLCGFFIGTAAFTIEVDQNELKQAENTPIEFINYTGPHTEIDSLQSIGAIGQGLSGAVKRGRAGDMNRYAVIHAVDPAVPDGLDADILILGAAAQVDHINNLRVIIASYLRGAYGYSEKDAKTIAHFVTIYNAVYRGDLNSFKAKYKAAVMRYLTADKAGLALRYDEWAGKTQIVIPLSDVKYSGTLSAIDTSSISDKKVVEKMREQDDRDIASRKDMIDLKERESGEARKRADAAQKDAQAAQKDAEAKRKEAEAAQQAADKSKTESEKSKQEAEKARLEAEAAQKRAEQSRKEAADAKKQAAKDPKDSKAAADAEKKRQEAEKDKQDAADKRKAAAEKAGESKQDGQAAAAKQKEADVKRQQAEEAEKKARDKAKEAAAEKQFADSKEAEAQSDRKDVAADTRKILEDKKAERKAQDEAAFASALPGAVLKVVDSGAMLSEIVLLDLKTEKPLKTSSLNTVRGRFLIEGTESLIAIAGSKGGNQMITLVAVNPRTLEITKQASVPVAEQSVLVHSDEGYYAVIEQGGKFYVARFNENLELQAKSALAVIPYTAISITDKGILVQDTGNSIRLLKADTLAEALK